MLPKYTIQQKKSEAAHLDECSPATKDLRLQLVVAIAAEVVCRTTTRCQQERNRRNERRPLLARLFEQKIYTPKIPYMICGWVMSGAKCLGVAEKKKVNIQLFSMRQF